MNTLKLVSILILLCGVLSFSGCLGDGGNTLSVYSTGSIYKTSTGTSYMFIDPVYLRQAQNYKVKG